MTKTLAPKTERDQNYLKANGWRLITSKPYQYGMNYYWDHDQHQRRDGRWWTQGDAIARQKKIDKGEA